MSESLPLTAPKGDGIYPEPLSVSWRVHHWSGYITGGIFFIIGSVAYLPPIENYALGGWAYTVGSAGFLTADLLEWWKNNHVGCILDSRQRKSYEYNVGQYLEPIDTLIGKFQRAENGVNFFLSAIGSALYLIGSVLIIPQVGLSVMGTEVYIYGSLIIFLSQAWKLYRSGCVNPQDPRDRRFKSNNWATDWPAFFVDLYAGLGGLAYMIGSIYYLPAYDTSDTITWIATIWFNVGGVFFFLSGLYMYHRYFHTLNYPH